MRSLHQISNDSRATILSVYSSTFGDDRLYSSFTPLTLELLMQVNLNPPLTSTESPTPGILDPLAIINAMLDLRAQMAELEQQVQALQPAFYAACLALKLEKIATDRATISRRLTPGKWAYSNEIVEQEDLLKQLKSQFQQAHEPIGGREVYWVIKFLLASV